MRCRSSFRGRYVVRIASVLILVCLLLILVLGLFNNDKLNVINVHGSLKDTDGPVKWKDEITKTNSNKMNNNKLNNSTFNNNNNNNSDDDNSARLIEQNSFRNSPRMVSSILTAEEFRKESDAKTGNALIDNYQFILDNRPGDKGLAVNYSKNTGQYEEVMRKFQINGLVSDVIPLNRIVPDSRPKRCATHVYPKELPSASVVITFHNEWYTVILRTLYSILLRTPRYLLSEIILVDDASTLDNLKDPLEDYIAENFPKGLINVIRLKKRCGLTNARVIGWRNSTGDVVVFFDSHMEVNIDWLQPLLYEIKKDRKILAVGTLDYVNANDFSYSFYDGFQNQYGFDWRLVFFETYWRTDQLKNKDLDEPRTGPIFVGTAFAVESNYFKEIGAYDEAMQVWGGENLEISWRVWLCGGRLVYVPCSHLGHIARIQPYSFPGGRAEIEMYNYKRAVDVWMGEYKYLVYANFVGMKELDVGDLSERLQIKDRLQCKNFSWYLDNIWPELNAVNRDALMWGSLKNVGTSLCLDTNDHIFPYAQYAYTKPCTHSLSNQGFGWKKDATLRSSLHCAGAFERTSGIRVSLTDCVSQTRDTWHYFKSDGCLHCVEMGMVHYYIYRVDFVSTSLKCNLYSTRVKQRRYLNNGHSKHMHYSP